MAIRKCEISLQCLDLYYFVTLFVSNDDLLGYLFSMHVLLTMFCFVNNEYVINYCSFWLF